jgi:hypothetical protein
MLGRFISFCVMLCYVRPGNVKFGEFSTGYERLDHVTPG